MSTASTGSSLGASTGPDLGNRSPHETDLPMPVPASAPPAGASCSTSAAETHAASMKDVAQEKLEQLKEGATHLLEQGKEKAAELGHKVEQLVRTEPTKALLAATAAGFVLGMLLLPRK